MERFNKNVYLQKRKAFIDKIVDEIITFNREFADYCKKYDETVLEEILENYEKRCLHLETLRQQRILSEKRCNFFEDKNFN